MTSSRTHNATKHGLYAGDAVLPWEDKKDFAAFHNSVRLELDPIGPLQDEAVRELAELHWRKRRLAWGQMLPFYTDPTPPEMLQSTKDGVSGLASYLAEDVIPPNHKSIQQTTFEALREMTMRSGSKIEKAVPEPENHKAPRIDRDLVMLAYDPTRSEQLLKIEAMLENRITKVMARLVMLKEYQRLYVQRTLTAPSANGTAKTKIRGTISDSTKKR